MKTQAKQNLTWISSCLLVLGILLSQSTAQGSVIAIGSGDFDAGSTLITFDGIAIQTDVNFVLTGGVDFAYTAGIGAVRVLPSTDGPSDTNNLSGPILLSVGNNTGFVIMNLPGFSTQFGYGFALDAPSPLQFGTAILLFDGATQVGDLPFSASLDPTFPGGFAGIESTIPFDSVRVVFNAFDARSFAMDNIVFNSVDSSSSVPEPSSLLLMGFGLSGLLLAANKHRKH